MFEQNPHHTLNQIVVKHIPMKNDLNLLDLEQKCQGHSRNQKTMTWGTKNMPSQKNLSRGSLSNWCDIDADAYSSKTICQPPPYTIYIFGGRVQLMCFVPVCI